KSPGRRGMLTRVTAPFDDNARVHGFFERVGRFEARHPGPFVAAGLALTIVLAVAAWGLELHPAFEELLPEGQPSVVELRRVLSHVAGTGRVFVALEGDGAGAARGEVRRGAG